MGKTVKMSFEGKSQQEIGKWTGVKYHNIQTCLLVYAADSGERLQDQDHWSSGLKDLKKNMRMSPFCIPKVLKCAAKILKIGQQLKMLCKKIFLNRASSIVNSPAREVTIFI